MANGLGAEGLLTVLGRGFQGFVQGRQRRAAELEAQRKREEEQKKFEKQQRLTEAKFMSDIFKNVANIEGGADRNQILNDIFQRAGLLGQDQISSPTPFDFQFQEQQLDPLDQANLERIQAQTALATARRGKLEGGDKTFADMNTNELLDIIRKAGQSLESGGLDEEQEDSVRFTIQQALDHLIRNNLTDKEIKRITDKRRKRKEETKSRLRSMGINIPGQDTEPVVRNFSKPTKKEDQRIIDFLKSKGMEATPANIEFIRSRSGGRR